MGRTYSPGGKLALACRPGGLAHPYTTTCSSSSSSQQSTSCHTCPEPAPSVHSWQQQAANLPQTSTTVLLSLACPPLASLQLLACISGACPLQSVIWQHCRSTCCASRQRESSRSSKQSSMQQQLLLSHVRAGPGPSRRQGAGAGGRAAALAASQQASVHLCQASTANSRTCSAMGVTGGATSATSALSTAATTVGGRGQQIL